MFTDFVFPNNNEQEFIDIASKLGYSRLFLIYPYSEITNEEKIKENINKLQSDIKIKLTYAFLLNFKQINKIRKNEKYLLIKSSEKDRLVIERKKADIIFSFEDHQRKDYIHHRASGLNHVLCTFAQKNNIIIGFSFNSILKAKNRKKLFGRISQNIKLCRKYKNKTLIASFAHSPYEMRSPKDLISLFVCLGMHPSEAKNSLK